jgi:hypothetical protein
MLIEGIVFPACRLAMQRAPELPVHPAPVGGELGQIRCTFFYDVPAGTAHTCEVALRCVPALKAFQRHQRPREILPSGAPTTMPWASAPPRGQTQETGIPCRNRSTSAVVGRAGIAPRLVVVIAPTALAYRQIARS